uniref:Secreted peptide n=1 Tax=Anopheles braziliensis TaxID=58242 RepID=A0A2M3ZLK8_9DIPT
MHRTSSSRWLASSSILLVSRTRATMPCWQMCYRCPVDAKRMSSTTARSARRLWRNLGSSVTGLIWLASSKCASWPELPSVASVADGSRISSVDDTR